MSAAWIAVPLAVGAAGLILTVIAWRRIVASRRRWAASWEGFRDERTTVTPWRP
jgi:hypothetical protein